MCIWCAAWYRAGSAQILFGLLHLGCMKDAAYTNMLFGRLYDVESDLSVFVLVCKINRRSFQIYLLIQVIKQYVRMSTRFSQNIITCLENDRDDLSKRNKISATYWLFV